MFCSEFSPDGRALATGSFDKSLYLWHAGKPGRYFRFGTCGCCWKSRQLQFCLHGKNFGGIRTLGHCTWNCRTVALSVCVFVLVKRSPGLWWVRKLWSYERPCKCCPWGRIRMCDLVISVLCESKHRNTTTLPALFFAQLECRRCTGSTMVLSCIPARPTRVFAFGTGLLKGDEPMV